ncbi:MAG TPA: hypothetical protein VF170_19500 [Planctomycetaceae bacterium]
MTVRTRIVSLGKARGVRIPDELLAESGLSGEVELRVEGHKIVIDAATNPREGWDEAFAKMAERGDDRLLDPETPTQWDETEWEW